MAQPPPIRRDFQADFSGGANAFTSPALLEDNEVASLTSLFARLGGGVEARKGFKLYTKVETDQGTSIFEMNQSTGTILTFVAAGASWYDETMWPRYRLFNQTPGTGDIVYFGAREPFNSLILFTILGLVPPTAGNTFVWEIFKGGDYTVLGNWQDITAQVIENVANSKQMRGAAAGEWIFSWPNQALWAPGQVETRGYQYWLRIRCTLGGTNMGTDIVQGQRRVRGDWVGRRHLMIADTGHLIEWPGLTLTDRVVETWPTGQRIPRVNAAVLNDHLYYTSDGQRPLRRWNGSRGTTRAGGSNNTADAGLVAPSAAPVLTQPTPNATAFPNGNVHRYRLAFEHGPESILGESTPSASTELTVAAGPNNIRVGFAAAVTQAATIPVNAILIYRTVDLQNTTILSIRDRIRGFLLVKRITRDDVDWNAGFWEDTYVESIGGSPIAYSNTPPFYPKGITSGGERLWIWNELYVAWSDIGRGDSWNAENKKQFSDVKGICYRGGKLYVFHSEDISTIELPPGELPNIQYFWRGIGNVQPDTIAVVYDQIHFVSREGPARIIGNKVELTAKGRQFEVGGYWNGSCAQRRLAAAAGFQGRVWFGVDSSGAGPGLSDVVTLDMAVNPKGAWSRQFYNNSFKWGAFGVVHAPLDHALARQQVLLAFPDGSFSSDYHKLALLEYGTTDNWTSAETDGEPINPNMTTRAISMGAADRLKEFLNGHALIRIRKLASAAVQVTGLLVSNHGGNPSKLVTYTPDGIDYNLRVFNFYGTEQNSAGQYRHYGPSLFIAAQTDAGFQLLSWQVRASVNPFRVPA